MSGPPPPASDEATEILILDVFRERHRHDLSLRDDVFRTLPFFATALGVVIAAVGAITSRLPPFEQIAQSRLLLAVSAVLALALAEGFVVLAILGRITARNRYAEPATEQQILLLLAGSNGVPPASTAAMRENMIKNYASIAPHNRARTQASSTGRSLAAVNLVISLMLTLLATTLILVADKLALLSKVTP